MTVSMHTFEGKSEAVWFTRWVCFSFFSRVRDFCQEHRSVTGEAGSRLPGRQYSLLDQLVKLHNKRINNALALKFIT